MREAMVERGGCLRPAGESVLRRAPRAALRPFVRALWASPAGPAPLPARIVVPGLPLTPCDAPAAPRRERMLPAGTAHLVLRLGSSPARVFDGADDLVGRALPFAVVGGPRSASTIRDATPASDAVGVELEPGAAGLLFPGGAHELAHRHTALSDLWGAAADELRDRLAGTADVTARLDLLEDALAERLPRVRGIPPVIAHALRRLAEGADVGRIVAETGYSHRHFGAMFQRTVGLAPRTYGRVRRFHAAVELSRRHTVAGDTPSWATIAAAVGYADQPHLTREFRAMAGVTPGRYAALAPREPRHVPIA